MQSLISRIFPIGTRTILFGVHAFWLHPFLVARAWRFYHGKWPSIPEWICIFSHDIGYIGMPDLDGELGQTHPELGARLAGRLVYYYARLRGRSKQYAEFLEHHYREVSLFHSRFYAARHSAHVSILFMPDKLCVLFEPRWFYLLRARLSGEVYEYIANAGDKLPGKPTPANWHAWYQRKVFSMLSDPKYRPGTITYV